MSTTDLAQRIQAVWALNPQAPALEFDHHWFSWGELRAAVATIDGLLNQAGVGPAAAVGVVLRNRPGMLATLLALLLSGRCIVSLSPFQPNEELQKDLRDLRLDAVIGDAQDWSTGAMQVACEVGSVRSSWKYSSSWSFSPGRMPV